MIPSVHSNFISLYIFVVYSKQIFVALTIMSLSDDPNMSTFLVTLLLSPLWPKFQKSKVSKFSFCLVFGCCMHANSKP